MIKILEIVFFQSVIQFHFTENVNFKLPEVPNDDINTRTGEEDVNTRFINLDLNQFAGQVRLIISQMFTFPLKISYNGVYNEFLSNCLSYQIIFPIGCCLSSWNGTWKCRRQSCL